MIKKITEWGNCSRCRKKITDFGKENNSFLPLFEWETEDYKELAKQKGIALNIEPIHFFLDKKSGFVFCLEYGMFNQPCPFLENNKCSVYNNRALVCRQFPLVNTPEYARETKEFQATKSFSASDFFLKCQNFENKKYFDETFIIGNKISSADIQDYLKEVYEKCYDYALQSNALKKLLADFLQTMVEQKQIKLRKISKFDLNKHKVIIGKTTTLPIYSCLVCSFRRKFNNSYCEANLK